MAYLRVTSPTWFDYHPLRPGDIVEVSDEAATQLKRIGVGRDSNKSAFEAFEKLKEEEAADAARARGETPSTEQSEEDLETERRAQERAEREGSGPRTGQGAAGLTTAPPTRPLNPEATPPGGPPKK